MVHLSHVCVLVCTPCVGTLQGVSRTRLHGTIGHTLTHTHTDFCPPYFNLDSNHCHLRLHSSGHVSPFLLRFFGSSSSSPFSDSPFSLSIPAGWPACCRSCPTSFGHLPLRRRRRRPTSTRGKPRKRAERETEGRAHGVPVAHTLTHTHTPFTSGLSLCVFFSVSSSSAALKVPNEIWRPLTVCVLLRLTSLYLLFFRFCFAPHACSEARSSSTARCTGRWPHHTHTHNHKHTYARTLTQEDMRHHALQSSGPFFSFFQVLPTSTARPVSVVGESAC